MQPPVAHPSRQNSFAGVVSSISPETPKRVLKNDMEKVIPIQSDSRGQKGFSPFVQRSPLAGVSLRPVWPHLSVGRVFIHGGFFTCGVPVSHIKSRGKKRTLSRSQSSQKNSLCGIWLITESSRMKTYGNPHSKCTKASDYLFLM